MGCRCGRSESHHISQIHLETGGEKENKAAAKSPAKKTQGKKKPSDDDSGSDDDDDDDDGPAVMRTVTYIAQRYVEKPLLPMGRKMDIRQWVLVTDWQPLTVWFYRDCYIRFAAEDYELQDLDNLFMHLTNNSVAKHSDSFETGQVGDLNMWHSNVMAEWLHKQGHGDAWCDRITPAMKHAVKSVMLASQGCIEPRKNSYELYGFDFLLDEQLNVWLLEVNCSPTLEHSTPVTSQLIPAMVDDLMKVSVCECVCV
jgi:tubulin monoglycylase TTLL3/8